MKTSALLQLVRLPNLFTAMGDVVAGLCIVSGSLSFSWPLLALLLCSASLYAAGCALNDLCDLETDSKERPERPLPSGSITTGQAKRVITILILLAGGLALTAGGRSLVVTILLVGCIFLYDCLAKKNNFWGPATMAGCRALNLALGMSLGAAAGLAPLYPLLTFIYVFCLTLLSRYEVTGNPGQIARLPLYGLVGISTVLAGLVGRSGHLPAALLFVAVLLIVVLPPLTRLSADSGGTEIKKSIKTMILGIPLLDASYAAGSAGLAAGLFILLFLLPAIIVGRRLAMT